MKIRSSPAAPILALVVVLALSACTSGAPDSGAPDTATAATPSQAAEPGASMAEEPAESSPANEQPPVGEAGSFTVNGTEFAVTNLNRCIPFNDSPGNIDLQPIARGAQLNLYLSGDSVEVSVQGSAIQEEFGSIAFGDDPVVHDSAVSGDRWTGSATVADSLGSGETVDIAWDVMVPAEVRDCSL